MAEKERREDLALEKRGWLLKPGASDAQKTNHFPVLTLERAISLGFACA